VPAGRAKADVRMARADQGAPAASNGSAQPGALEERIKAGHPGDGLLAALLPAGPPSEAQRPPAGKAAPAQHPFALAVAEIQRRRQRTIQERHKAEAHLRSLDERLHRLDEAEAALAAVTDPYAAPRARRGDAAIIREYIATLRPDACGEARVDLDGLMAYADATGNWANAHLPARERRARLAMRLSVFARTGKLEKREGVGSYWVRLQVSS
jgi:hypothetical protein